MTADLLIFLVGVISYIGFFGNLIVWSIYNSSPSYYYGRRKNGWWALFYFIVLIVLAYTGKI